MSAPYAWHAVALVVACIWGSTFVASKVLLMAGLNPAEIMALRFFISWLLMVAAMGWPRQADAARQAGPAADAVQTDGAGRARAGQRRRVRLRDEALFVVLGLTGGSLYFLAENTAVDLTRSTSTVALLIGATPVITALMNRCVHRDEHLSGRFMAGSMVALAGTALVVFNGVYVLDDNPLVIVLSLASAATWGIYSLVIRRVERRYSSVLITRKVFFWGIVTMLPVLIAMMYGGESQLAGPDAEGHLTWHAGLLLRPDVALTLAFLSVVASLGCFLLWNVVIRHIGIIASGNYLYFNPVTSLFVAYIVLGERITPLAVVGCGLTIAGVWLCNRR